MVILSLYITLNPLTNTKGPAGWLSRACIARALAFTLDCQDKGLYHFHWR